MFITINIRGNNIKIQVHFIGICIHPHCQINSVGNRTCNIGKSDTLTQSCPPIHCQTPTLYFSLTFLFVFFPMRHLKFTSYVSTTCHTVSNITQVSFTLTLQINMRFLTNGYFPRSHSFPIILGKQYGIDHSSKPISVGCSLPSITYTNNHLILRFSSFIFDLLKKISLKTLYLHDGK